MASVDLYRSLSASSLCTHPNTLGIAGQRQTAQELRLSSTAGMRCGEFINDKRRACRRTMLHVPVRRVPRICICATWERLHPLKTCKGSPVATENPASEILLDSGDFQLSEWSRLSINMRPLLESFARGGVI
jgi:hypothetical protein